jgi:hypothetical protein
MRHGASWVMAALAMAVLIRSPQKKIGALCLPAALSKWPKAAVFPRVV